ncbi:hypothetical protein HZS_6855, partial [Henneguya salminicola]
MSFNFTENSEGKNKNYSLLNKSQDSSLQQTKITDIMEDKPLENNDERDDLKIFLIKTYEQNNSIREFMLMIEERLIYLVHNKSKGLIYSHPQVDKFHRLIIHKISDYYYLDHTYDPMTFELTVSPTAYSSLQPQLNQLYNEHQTRNKQDYNSPRPVVKILKNPNRIDSACRLTEKQPAVVKTFEERKASYIEARSRILGVSVEECEAQFKNSNIDVINILVSQDINAAEKFEEAEQVKQSFCSFLCNFFYTYCRGKQIYLT